MRGSFICLVLGLVPGPLLAGANDISEISDRAKSSIMEVFRIDGEQNMAVIGGDKVDRFVLYTADAEGRYPVTYVTCDQSARFGIASVGEDGTGLESFARIKIGICDSNKEIDEKLIENQKEVHALIAPQLKEILPEPAATEMDSYLIKEIGSSYRMHAFFVLLFGHGVVMSPTAMVMSDDRNTIALLQLDLPPQCNSAKSKQLTMCTNLNKAFEIIALSLLDHN